MPIYQYKCSKCNYKLEKLHKSYKESIKICPKCNNISLKKIISLSSFKLKGNGWYITDFKNKKQKNENKK